MTYSDLQDLFPAMNQSKTIRYNHGKYRDYLVEIDYENKQIILSPYRFAVFGQKTTLNFDDADPSKFLITDF